MPNIKLIAALDDKNGISKNNKLPWDLPTDRQYFQDKVKDGPVVMGWKTFATNNFKPYGHGDNTVLTRRKTEAIPGVWVVHSAKDFFENHDKDVWVAGGGQVFKEALPYASHLFITRIKGNFDCDVFFPEFEKDFVLSTEEPQKTENGVRYITQVWVRKNN